VPGDDAAAEQAPADLAEAGGPHRFPELLGAREPAHAGGQVRVRRPAWKDLAGERDEAVEPEREERAQEPPRPRDLEAAEAAARPEDARELAEAPLELRDVSDPEADGDGVEAPVRERELEHVSAQPLDGLGLPAGPLEHALREVEPGHARAGALRLDREVAGATARVEHPVSRTDDCADREPAPAAVEARRHQPVHGVVDRRDPVEHRLDGSGGQRSGAHCPHRPTSV
jgi:hypothetical protein